MSIASKRSATGKTSTFDSDIEDRLADNFPVQDIQRRRRGRMQDREAQCLQDRGRHLGTYPIDH